MKQFILTILLTLSSAAFADSASLKPGLWEIQLLQQVVDGHDISAQMAAAQTEMQQAMANMPPAQRSQMEAMMGHSTVNNAAAGSYRICVSPAMAARNQPMIDPQGHCQPTNLIRTGNQTHFAFNCTSHGHTEVGKGVSSITGNLVKSRIDMTMTNALGSHTMHTESQMKFLGADCEGIKPIDQLAKETQGATGQK